MPLEDVFSDLVSAGADGKGWKSFWALIGLGLGAVLGGWLGFQTGFGAMIWQGAIGAFLGWTIGVALKGLFRILALMILFAIPVVAWFYLTGQFG